MSLPHNLDALYDLVDDHLLEGCFKEVRRLCQEAMAGSTPLPVLVGLITITVMWRGELRASRQALAEYIMGRAVLEHGQESAERMLKGLI